MLAKQPWEMQPDDEPFPNQASTASNRNDDNNASEEQAARRPSTHSRTAYFTTPAPLKRLFDRFPLRTYASNGLPLAASQNNIRLHQKNVLYVFGAPSELSLNPTCLRYQTLLLFAGIPFETATSNNHASPAGSLPFLITAQDPFIHTSKTIPASGLKSFVRSRNPQTEMELDASPVHLALLDPIRRAYLAALYLDGETFKSICAPMYVDTVSRSSVVRAAYVPPLRSAAVEEVLSTRNEAPPTDTAEQLKNWWSGSREIDEGALFEEAQEAFRALDAILGDARWFSRSKSSGTAEEAPGWLDASVFAYTHVILTLFGGGASGAAKGAKKRRPLAAEKMYQAVAKHKELVAHRDRILTAYG